MTQLVGLNTTSEIWSALETLFAAASKARIMQLRLQIQTSKKGGSSMMEYLLKVKSIADNLAAIGEPVSEQDQILYLLGGLGAEYISFVIYVTSRPESLSLEEIHSMLLTYENCLEQQNSVDPSALIQANTMAVQGPNRRNQRPNQV